MLGTRPTSHFTIERDRLKTPARFRNENTLPIVPQTIKPAPKTPAVSRLNALLDVTNAKTPFPRASKPLDQKQKQQQPELVLQVQQPTTTIIADDSSVLRTRRRVKVPRSANKNTNSFETPEPTGKHHWDVSEGEISVDVIEQEPDPAAMALEYGDVEYMPPSASEQPYFAPMELPDYAALGAALHRLGRQPIVPEPEPEFQVDEAALLRACADDDAVVLVPEPLEDDLFPPPPRPPTRLHRKTASGIVLRPGSVAASSRPSSAAGMSARVRTPITRASTSMARTRPQPPVVVPEWIKMVAEDDFVL